MKPRRYRWQPYPVAEPKAVPATISLKPEDSKASPLVTIKEKDKAVDTTDLPENRDIAHIIKRFRLLELD